MTTLLSNFVAKVQNKHWQNLRRKTQKLEPSEKEDLLELLEDHLAAPTLEPKRQDATESTNNENYDENYDDDDDDDDEYAEEDYELLQRDLDKANLRLEELQSKHDFLKTRLQTYRTKIQAAEDHLLTITNEDARREAMATKIGSYKTSLQPVEETFQSIAKELHSHQLKIESMQDRQLELKLKTQECKVVLEELCYGMEAKARLAFEGQDEEILAEIEGESKIATTDPESSFRDEDAGREENDDLENSGTAAAAEKDEDEEDKQEEQP